MSIELDIRKQLDGFTLDVSLAAGDDPIALLGASGSGKSMTLRCIAGVERPDEGRIVVNGETLFDSAKGIDLPPQMRHVGLLFQQNSLFPTMTVRQNIACGARRTKDRTLVDTLLEQFELTPLANRLPQELSGGQQQRAALARILASRPRLLLLDEPFSALDTALRWQVVRRVADTIAGFNGTSILVTHDQEEAFRLSAYIAVMEQGRAGELRDKRALFTHPQTCAEARIIGIENLTEAVVRTDGVWIPGWNVRLQLDDVPSNTQAIGVRADSLMRGTGKNVIQATVCQIWDGPQARYAALRPEGGAELLYWQCDAGTPLQVGEKLTVQIPADAILSLRL